MRDALNEFAMMLQIVHHAYSPDLIMIFSPFFADPSVLDSLTAAFWKNIERSDRVPLEVVSQRYPGESSAVYSDCYSNCYFSNCYEFFSAALSQKLLARF